MIGRTTTIRLGVYSAMAARTSKAFTNREKWLIGAVVIIAIVAIIAIFARPAGPGANSGAERAPQDAGAPAAPGAQQQQQQRDLSHLARREADDPTALGPVDAPVVMIEYSDYRCPYCGLYAIETQPALVAEYVDAGLLRIEWRDTPIFGEQSQDAAVAARAAGEQGLFWQYNTAVFELAQRGGHTDLPRERLLEIAQQIGVPDMTKFEADLESAELQARVGIDHAEATGIGVNSTPTFIIGNTPFAGAQPLETFREVIERELDAAGVQR